MIRKFCRIFCLVFLIGDFQSSLSQFDATSTNLPSPNINNGSIANLDDARYQASIRLIEKEITFGEGHICSGSLISSRVVLTAARCLFDAKFQTPRHPAELIVVIGTLNRYQQTEDTLISRVTHIRYPTSFDLATMRDDLGLLFLSKELPENNFNIRPIELNRKTAPINVGGSVTGWEMSKSGDVSNQLLVANVSIVDRLTCANTFEEQPISSGVICAKYNRIDNNICQSDVGAPLVHEGKQLGLASWTVSRCSTNSNHLAIYTDVSYHKEWIWLELTDENNSDSSIWGLLGLLTFTWFAFRDKKRICF